MNAFLLDFGGLRRQSRRGGEETMNERDRWPAGRLYKQASMILSTALLGSDSRSWRALKLEGPRAYAIFCHALALVRDINGNFWLDRGSTDCVGLSQLSPRSYGSVYGLSNTTARLELRACSLVIRDIKSLKCSPSFGISRHLIGRT